MWYFCEKYARFKAKLKMKWNISHISGTNLPMNMFQMATVTNPAKNGLLVIGGYSEVKWNYD